VIDAEEEHNKPWPVAAATVNIVAASLADLAGEDQSVISLDPEGWMSPKWEEWGIWNWR
jgi:hypothetical protein